MANTNNIKQVNVCRFLAEALSQQFGTFTEDSDVDPELIEGVVVTEQLDYDELRIHLNMNGDESETDNVIAEFKESIADEIEVFAYWEA